MTITLSLAAVIGIGLSLLLLCAVLYLCHQQGLFDGRDTYGLGGLFAVVLISLLWLAPSLAGWAIYATWWGGR